MKFVYAHIEFRVSLSAPRANDERHLHLHVNSRTCKLVDARRRWIAPCSALKVAMLRILALATGALALLGAFALLGTGRVRAELRPLSLAIARHSCTIYVVRISSRIRIREYEPHCATFGFDTAENEPAKKLQKFVEFWKIYPIYP